MYILLYSIWMNHYSWDVPDMIWIFGIFSSSVYYSRIHFGVAMFDMPTFDTVWWCPKFVEKTRALRARAKRWRRQYWPHVLLQTTWAQVEPRGVVVNRWWFRAIFWSPQNLEQNLWDVNNEMFWFGDFLMGLLVCKKKICWWFWGFPNFFQTLLIWMKMKKWSKDFHPEAHLDLPSRKNLTS